MSEACAADGGDGTARSTRRRWTAAALVAAAVLAGGIQVGVILVGEEHTPPTPLTGTPSQHLPAARPVGADLTSVPAPAGTGPPPNIVTSIVVPADAMATGIHVLGTSPGGYDASIDFTSPESPTILVAFFRQLLPRHGWSLQGAYALPTGPPMRGQQLQVLARHSGDDGFYWDIGITVPPSAVPSPSPTTGSSPSAGGASTFTLRLERVDESS